MPHWDSAPAGGVKDVTGGALGQQHTPKLTRRSSDRGAHKSGAKGYSERRWHEAWASSVCTLVDTVMMCHPVKPSFSSLDPVDYD
jgi:hypothetical protein